jgi:hypothetical protein
VSFKDRAEVIPMNILNIAADAARIVSALIALMQVVIQLWRKMRHKSEERHSEE